MSAAGIVRVIPLAGLGDHAVLASAQIAAVGGEALALDALVSTGALHAAEAAMAETMPPVRRATFVAGRIALRTALSSPRLAQPEDRIHDVPLGSTTRGAPQLPAGLTGSVSHKLRQSHPRAIAIAGAESGGLLGVDLETRPVASDRERPSIASRILTARELEVMRDLDALSHREATVLRFSLKEAIYKAIDPVVQRYVRFTEVELDVHEDGRASVSLLLPEFAGSVAQIEAWWQRDDEWIITTARLTGIPAR